MISFMQHTSSWILTSKEPSCTLGERWPNHSVTLHLKESANTPPAKTTTFDVLSIMYILLKSSRWFSTKHHNTVNQLEKNWSKIVMPRSWNKLYTKKQWRSSLLQCRPPGYMDIFFIWALMTCPRIWDAADYYKETTPHTLQKTCALPCALFIRQACTPRKTKHPNTHTQTTMEVESKAV